MLKIINKKTSLAISSIFLLEIFSFFGFLYPEFRLAVFVCLSFLVFVFSLKKLEYGLWFSAVELIIGSKGYLLYAQLPFFTLSLRMSLWLAVMFAFFIHLLILVYKKYYCPQVVSLKKILPDLYAYIKTKKYLKYYFGLFGFVFLSVLISAIYSNKPEFIFKDANAWIFLSYVFPFYYVYANGRRGLESFFSIIIGALIWLGLKTFFLLYVFSHNILTVMPDIYSWVRKTGVGEITRMESGFARIFFQSHIYLVPLFFVLFGLLIMLVYKNDKLRTNKIFYFLFAALSLITALNLTTLSRSNWVGIFVGFLALVFLAIYNYGLKSSWRFFVMSGAVFLSALLILSIIINFPYPQPDSRLGAGSLIKDRAGQINNEAGASSRWSLLPPLFKKVQEYFFLGSGFGSTVTYKSSDPRILEQNPDGEYETFAFEWGWLDIWLKLGLPGLLFYIYFLSKLLYPLWLEKKDVFARSKTLLYPMLGLGLLSIAVIHFFSPYLNHPLGFAYIIFLSFLLERE